MDWDRLGAHCPQLRLITLWQGLNFGSVDPWRSGGRPWQVNAQVVLFGGTTGNAPTHIALLRLEVTSFCFEFHSSSWVEIMEVSNSRCLTRSLLLEMKILTSNVTESKDELQGDLLPLLRLRGRSKESDRPLIVLPDIRDSAETNL